jgi:hypothetical protein
MTTCYHLNTEYDLQACQTLYDFLTFTKGLDLTTSALRIYLDDGNIEQRYCTILLRDSGRLEYYGFVNRVVTRTCDKAFDMHVYDFIKLFKNRRIEL